MLHFPELINFKNVIKAFEFKCQNFCKQNILIRLLNYFSSWFAFQNKLKQTWSRTTNDLNAFTEFRWDLAKEGLASWHGAGVLTVLRRRTGTIVNGMASLPRLAAVEGAAVGRATWKRTIASSHGRGHRWLQGARVGAIGLFGRRGFVVTIIVRVVPNDSSIKGSFVSHSGRLSHGRQLLARTGNIWNAGTRLCFHRSRRSWKSLHQSQSCCQSRSSDGGRRVRINCRIGGIFFHGSARVNSVRSLVTLRTRCWSRNRRCGPLSCVTESPLFGGARCRDAPMHFVVRRRLGVSVQVARRSELAKRQTASRSQIASLQLGWSLPYQQVNSCHIVVLHVFKGIFNIMPWVAHSC